MIIGLTGGIASGKSTVSRMLAERGAALVDADAVAREVVQPGEAVLEAISSLFGQAVIQEDGTLNRKALGDIVFRDKAMLEKLEGITHPAIRARMRETIRRHAEADPKRLVVADIPLLYETKQAHLYKGVMVVYVPASVQVQRLMERNGMEREEAERRVSLQMDIEEKRGLADWVIDNSGTIEETNKQIEIFWKQQEMT
ncbi:dephospho-CoA kinase [Paenibacillus sp. LHD-117]|uniref:dephospho-CoA kinase n=1 Tax=Paenibacillus sp. LHD-117 TaxID=3071412 RepID=UPI0027DF3CFD|nr:dephospho-CoA kinase [Paenibacillus sp. LHD-117]MDQ6418389.1 dephospho-CoA kinase [Paenibacillus sp. LHD-117]